MPEKVIKALVEGGKASAGPPLGPALSTAKVNIKDVIAKINEKTKEFAGISVPIEITVNLNTKGFEIKVGSPPVSQLIKKELGLQKLAKTPWGVPKKIEEGQKPEEFNASLTMEQIVKIAKSKLENLGTYDLKTAVKQVIGACTSCGVLVEGKKPKEIIKEVNSGKFDDKIKV